jgi:hypothetical protein
MPLKPKRRNGLEWAIEPLLERADVTRKRMFGLEAYDRAEVERLAPRTRGRIHGRTR